MKRLFVLPPLISAFTIRVCAVGEDADTAAEKLLDALSFNNLLYDVLDALSELFAPATRAFAILFCLVVLCAVVNNVFSGFGREDICAYISALVFSGYTFSIVTSLTENVAACTESIRNVTLSLLPGMVSANAAEGVFCASAAYTGTTAALAVCQSVVSESVLPCVKLLFVIALVGSVAGSFFDVSGISSFVRSCAVWVLSLSLTSVVTVMHFQNIVAKAKDSISARALRFASVSFIPVVGGLVGESLRTVTESIKAVKSITGVTGICAIIATILPPVLALLIYKGVVLLCAGFAKMLGTPRQASFLYEVNGILNILNATVFATAICFILVIGILASGM